MYRAWLKEARLRECCRQGRAEVVSNRSNKIHQTWGPPFSRSLYIPHHRTNLPPEKHAALLGKTGGEQIMNSVRGPSIKDIRKVLTPFLSLSTNLALTKIESVCFLAQPPLPLTVDVLYEWSQNSRASKSPSSVEDGVEWK